MLPVTVALVDLGLTRGFMNFVEVAVTGMECGGLRSGSGRRGVW